MTVSPVLTAQVAILAMMFICLGGRGDSGEWSGFHRDHPAFTGVLLCFCTIGIPAAGMHNHPPLIPMAHPYCS